MRASKVFRPTLPALLPLALIAACNRAPSPPRAAPSAPQAASSNQAATAAPRTPEYAATGIDINSVVADSQVVADASVPVPASRATPAPADLATPASNAVENAMPPPAQASAADASLPKSTISFANGVPFS